MEIENLPDIATPEQYERALGLKPGASASQRFRNEGPRYIKVGRRIRYRKADIIEYLDRNTVQTAHSA